MEDYLVRAIAANAQIRAFACTTRELVEKARQIHRTSPVMTAALGRLMSGAVMMGAMNKSPEDLVTLQIRSEGPAGGLTVTADGAGNVKGYANVPDVIVPANSVGKLNVSAAIGPGTLSVIKDMGLKEPYVGQVELQTGEIAEDLTYYFAASEQTPSVVGLGVLMNKENTVRQAGGFIIQLMPFCEEETIAKLEENIKKLESVTTMLEQGMTPEDIVRTVLDGFDVDFTDNSPTQYFCNCSKERVSKALISIGARELGEILEEGKDIEVNCHFCGTNYIFTPEEVRMLYDAATNHSDR